MPAIALPDVEAREAAFAEMSDATLLLRSMTILSDDAPTLASGQWSAYFIPSQERIVAVFADEAMAAEAKPCHCLVGAGLEAGGCFWEDTDAHVASVQRYTIPVDLQVLERKVIARLTALLYDHLDRGLILDNMLAHEHDLSRLTSPFFREYLIGNVVDECRSDVLYGYSDYVLHPMGSAGKHEAIKVYERALAAATKEASA